MATAELQKGAGWPNPSESASACLHYSSQRIQILPGNSAR